MSNENSGSDSKQNKLRIIMTIIGIALIIIGILLTAKYYIDTHNAVEETEELTSVISTANPLADNPIDFDTLKDTNDEIYAWIIVPGTKVDYPVVQSRESDDFYLKHSATDKKYSASGAIYTQSVNNTDFSDRVTVIYGHNNYGDTFFTTLHNFENEDTFNNNEYFTIYQPGRKLTYQIISAFKYDDRHIMNSFNFLDEKIYADFLDMIQNPVSANKNVRTSLDKEITTDDKIVILSTCVTNQKNNRYLVCGVLTEDEKTN